jgi:hypothetical protein
VSSRGGVHGEAMVRRCKACQAEASMVRCNKVLSLSREGCHSRKGRPCFYLLKVINE